MCVCVCVSDGEEDVRKINERKKNERKSMNIVKDLALLNTPAPA